MPVKHINPNFRILDKFINSLDVKGFYESTPAKTLYRKRNALRKFHQENLDFVVKSFEHTVLLNKYVYGLGIRQTKAERGYTNAMRLLSMELDTPQPIATVEVRKGGRLQRSYFAYMYSSLLPLLDVENGFHDLSKEDQDRWVEDITDYLITLHGKGVLHRDLHLNNILYKDRADGCRHFQLIDINRMDFKKKITPKERMENLALLTHDEDLSERILRAYAIKCGIKDKLVDKELKRRYRIRHYYKPIKHFFKHPFGNKREY